MAGNNLMDNLRVDLEISPDLQRLIDRNSEIAPKATKLGLRRITKEGSKQVKQRIRSMGLVDSGAYVKSVRGSTTNRKSFIGTTMWYAHILEDGAKPHLIKPRVKGRRRTSQTKFYKALRIRGRWVKSVNHPGIKGYHVFEKEEEHMQSSGQMKSLFALGVQEAIEEIQNGGS